MYAFYKLLDSYYNKHRTVYTKILITRAKMSTKLLIFSIKYQTPSAFKLSKSFT
jgi:hypothetical protein